MIFDNDTLICVCRYITRTCSRANINEDIILSDITEEEFKIIEEMANKKLSEEMLIEYLKSKEK